MLSIISNFFINKNQQESRVTVQPELVTEIIAKFAQKMSKLNSWIILQAFWLNQIDYLQRQIQYETAYVNTGTSSQSYQSMQVQMLKTNMQVQTLMNLIDTLRSNISITSDSALRNSTLAAKMAAQYQNARRKIMISNFSKAAQIFQYYKPPSITIA